MEAIFIGAPTRVWIATSDPDNDVHTEGGWYASIGEFFMNTSTGVLFLCLDGTAENQEWECSTNASLVNALITSAVPTRSQAPASRSLNSGFQINASRDALVNYSVDIATTLSLTTGQAGTVFLEIASDSGFTTDLQELGRFVNGNTGTLAIGLSLSQNVSGNLRGYVSAAYYVRLRTSNDTGTPTFTYRTGQEVLL